VIAFGLLALGSLHACSVQNMTGKNHRRKTSPTQH